MVPFQVFFPRHLTRPGIEIVCISSTRLRNPSGVRYPTMILGTPRRNDCIQNFNSFRSSATMSLISALVFSSTQFIGLSPDGLESQTVTISYMYSPGVIWELLARVNFSTYYESGVAYSRLNNRTILSIVIDNLVLSIFDIFSRSISPCIRQQTQSLELVAYRI
jgi:hypothetical protein